MTDEQNQPNLKVLQPTFAMANAADKLNYALAPLWYVARACCSHSLFAYLIIKICDDSTINFDADKPEAA
jgi:hypothetical protein